MRNARLASRKLHDGAWPLFARIIGTSTFTLTPGHVGCLATIAEHPQLKTRIKTLTLGSTYIDPSPTYQYTFWNPDEGDYSVQETRRRIRPLPTAEHSRVITDRWHRQEQLNADLQTIEDAWNETMRAQADFFDQTNNACIRKLTNLFRNLTQLRNLRVTAGPLGSLDPSHDTREPSFYPWLRKEFFGHLPLSRRYELLKNFNIHGPYSFVRNEHFNPVLIEAIIKSQIQIHTILNDGNNPSGLSAGTLFPQHDSTDLMVSAFRSLRAAGSLTELHTIKLNSSIMAKLRDNRDEVAPSLPSAEPLLNALFTAAPRLKHLYLEGMLWRLDGAVGDMTCIPKLELLSLSNMNFQPSAVLALASSSLTMLRLHDMCVLDPQTELPQEWNELEPVVWHDLLPKVVDRARLKMIELRDVTRCYDANARALACALPKIAKKVPFVAQRSTFPYDDDQDYFPCDSDHNKVFLNGVEVDDGYEENSPSKMGLWINDRLGLPLGVGQNDETELLRGVP